MKTSPDVSIRNWHNVPHCKALQMDSLPPPFTIPAHAAISPHHIFIKAMQRCTRRFYGTCKAIKCESLVWGRVEYYANDYAKLCMYYIEYLLGMARKLYMPAYNVCICQLAGQRLKAPPVDGCPQLSTAYGPQHERTHSVGRLASA